MKKRLIIWNSIWNSMIYRWIFSYLIIILISAIGMVVSYAFIYRSLGDEVNKSTQLLVNQVQRDYDECISSIERISAGLSGNEAVKKYAAYNRDITEEQRFDLLNLPYVLEGLKKASDGTGDYFLYFSSNSIVSTVNTNVDALVFMQMKNLNITYDTWINYLSADTGNKMIKIHTTDGKTKYLYTLRSFFTRQYDTENMTFGVLFDANDFVKVIEKYGDDINVMLKFYDNSVMSLTGTEILEIPSSDSSITTIKNKKYLFSKLYSTVWNMEYIAFVPLLSVMKNMIFIKVIYFVIFLFITIICVILAILFSKMNYRPVTALINDCNFLSKKEDIYQRKIKNEYIIKLLNDDYTNAHDFINELNSLGIEFISDIFSVMIIYIDESDDYSSDAFAVANILEELCSERHKGYVVEKKGLLVCLVNFSNLHNNRSFKDEIIDISSKTIQVMKQELGTNIIFASSEVVRGHEYLGKAYIEALGVMDYKLNSKNSDVLFLIDIYNKNEIDFYYSQEQESLFINSLVSGQADTAHNILNNAYNNMLKTKWQVLGIKTFVSDVLCSIVRAACISGNETSDYIIGLNPQSLIASNDEFINQLHDIIEKFCENVNDNGNHPSTLEKMVTEYINDNFDDYNLNLSQIASHLNMHPVYVSSAFKEQCGEGISERILKIRMSKAVIFLERGFSVSETGNKVGYLSTRTFSSAFKKYYGELPSKFIKS